MNKSLFCLELKAKLYYELREITRCNTWRRVQNTIKRVNSVLVTSYCCRTSDEK